MIRLLPLCLALVGVSGCDFGSDEMVTLDNACSGASDCGANAVCDEGICTNDTSAEVSVVVEVLRSADDTLGETPASWAFSAASFSRVGTKNYELPATKQVAGTVRWGEVRVPATLTFQRRMESSLSALTPAPVEVDTLRDPVTTELAEFDYTTKLVTGADYSLVVAPSADMLMAPDGEDQPALRVLPPLYIDEVEVPGGGDPFTYDVSYPLALNQVCGPNQLVGCRLTGQVFSTDTETEVPAPGLQVRAVQKVTGLIVSSIGQTDENGFFEIRVSEQAGEYLVRVTSVAGAAEPFPSVSFDPAFFFPQDPDLRILIPRIDPVTLTGRVVDEDERLVPTATIQFSSDTIFDDTQLQLMGSFKATATTTDEGSFTIELLPGLYEILVTPPEDAATAWGVLPSAALIEEDTTMLDMDLVVPSQVPVSGSVSTFANEAAPGATIQARSRGTTMPFELARTQEVSSDDKGAFGMTLDVGLFDMLVKVSSETGFPWAAEIGLTTADSDGLTRNYELDAPIVVRGDILTSAGVPVSTSQIRAYILVSGPGEEEELRPVQIADTATTQEGMYRLLLSPSLASE